MLKDSNCGIYKITNVLDGKVYVGSSVDLKDREHNHFYNLNKGTHSNKYLQNAFNRHGRDNFIFEVLEYLERGKDKLKEIILDRENHYIIKLRAYDPQRITGYNICPLAGNRLGTKHSEETKEKISTTRYKKKVINLTTTKEFDSMEDAAKFYSLEPGNISRACKGKYSKVGGYYWSFIEEEYKKDIVPKQDYTQGYKVINLTTCKEFNSVTEASKYYEIKSISGILAACKGERKSAGGYNWAYADNSDKLLYVRKRVINLTTNKEFNSLEEAARFYNIKAPSNISRVCRGYKKSTNGFEWAFVDTNIGGITNE